MVEIQPKSNYVFSEAELSRMSPMQPFSIEISREDGVDKFLQTYECEELHKAEKQYLNTVNNELSQKASTIFQLQSQADFWSKKIIQSSISQKILFGLASLVFGIVLPVLGVLGHDYIKARGLNNKIKRLTANISDKKSRLDSTVETFKQTVFDQINRDALGLQKYFVKDQTGYRASMTEIRESQGKSVAKKLFDQVSHGFNNNNIKSLKFMSFMQQGVAAYLIPYLLKRVPEGHIFKDDSDPNRGNTYEIDLKKQTIKIKLILEQVNIMVKKEDFDDPNTYSEWDKQPPTIKAVPIEANIDFKSGITRIEYKDKKPGLWERAVGYTSSSISSVQRASTLIGSTN